MHDRERQVVVVQGGGAGSVFAGLFLFFIVLPVVTVLGCFACTGTMMHSVNEARDEARAKAKLEEAQRTLSIQEQDVEEEIEDPVIIHRPQPVVIERPPVIIDPDDLPDPPPLGVPPSRFGKKPNPEPARGSFNRPIVVEEARDKANKHEPRTWTSTNGKTVTATFVSAGAGKVKLLREDGKEITVEKAKLSEADHKYLDDLARM